MGGGEVGQAAAKARNKETGAAVGTDCKDEAEIVLNKSGEK
jgi:hypothetical protein